MIPITGTGMPQDEAGFLDPKAEAYARKRLMQMAKAGLLGPFGQVQPGEGGYAAIWRLLSQSIAGPAAAAGYQNPGMFLRNAGRSRPHPPRPIMNMAGGKTPTANPAALIQKMQMVGMGHPNNPMPKINPMAQRLTRLRQSYEHGGGGGFRPY